MFISGFVLAGLGIYTAVVGTLWFLAKAFGKGIGWGLLSLLLPPAGLVFAIKYWRESWRPLTMHILGSGAAFGGAALLMVSVTQDTAAGLAQSLQALQLQGISATAQGSDSPGGSETPAQP